MILDVLQNAKVSYRAYKENKPNFVTHSGVQYWLVNLQKHRVNGPAVIHPDGDEEWWLHGHLHREDGPAKITYMMEDSDNDFPITKETYERTTCDVYKIEYWYIHGKNVSNVVKLWMDENDITWPLNEEQIIEMKLRLL